jgi:hypothetical protein
MLIDVDDIVGTGDDSTMDEAKSVSNNDVDQNC